MSTCLIVHPEGTPLANTCPRCQGEAGDHPAPQSLMARISPEFAAALKRSDAQARQITGVRGRPTYREAYREAVRLVSRVVGADDNRAVPMVGTLVAYLNDGEHAVVVWDDDIAPDGGIPTGTTEWLDEIKPAS